MQKYGTTQTLLYATKLTHNGPHTEMKNYKMSRKKT